MHEHDLPPDSSPSSARHFSFPVFWRTISPSTKRTFATIGISILSSTLVLAIVGGILWQKRQILFAALVREVSTENNLAAVSPHAPTLVSTTAINRDLSVAEVVARANKSVVSIEVYKEVPLYAQGQSNNPFGNLFPGFFFGTPQQVGTEEQKVGGGSGFFVASDGLIVTNRHVVDVSGGTFKVITIDGKKYTARVVAKDAVLDIALLRVTGSSFTPVTFGNSDSLVLGQSVVAIGYALGEFKNSVSTGIVSGLSRSIVAGDTSGKSEMLEKTIQTDAAINPGNSGGPLLNLRGEVVGVNVAVAQGSQNIAFALPINTVKSVVDSVQKNGTIVRPYVGIRYIPITNQLQKQNNLSVDYGILVARGQSREDLAVIPGSPADRAGIVENDIILSVDGVALTEETNFSSIIRMKTVGTTIVLRVLHGGVEKNVAVTLLAAPTEE